MFGPRLFSPRVIYLLVFWYLFNIVVIDRRLINGNDLGRVKNSTITIVLIIIELIIYTHYVYFILFTSEKRLEFVAYLVS